MTEPSYTNAQIESMVGSLRCAAKVYGPNDQGLYLAARMLRSLLSERQAAMQGQGGELVRATEYAERIAQHLWRNHYVKDAPQWEPLSGDLRGLLSQIDNMCAGITNSQQPQPVRSVSDEDVMTACRKYYNCGHPVHPPVFEGMRAALEHFAAIAQEKQS